MRSFYSRAVIYSLIILLGLLSALPNVLPDPVLQKLPSWYADNQITLGLDVRGGSHLLLAVNQQQLQLNSNQAFTDKLIDELRVAKIRHDKPQVNSDSIGIGANEAVQLNQIARVARALMREQGGSTPLYHVEEQGKELLLTTTDLHQQALIRDAVERSLEVVRRRLDETGMVEPIITRQGKDSILVQLPGVEDPSHIRTLLGTTASMTFHWVANHNTIGEVMALPGQLPSESFRLEKRIALKGEHISDAAMGFDQNSGEPVVTFRLDKEGARRFGDMTKINIGRPLAIVLDNQVITAPVIRSAITGGSGEISGSFSTAEAHDLALLLRAGALPAPLDVIEERTVGPDLGSDAIAMGISTGLVGALLVLLFMLGIYGRWGLIACIGLTLNVVLIFGVLGLLGATLTLPGIAGLILVIGMAVDANILINERIREETQRGASAYSALTLGFSKAYSTILDSNVTTLIAISLLFLFGSGPVRGFAVTMAVGLLLSMFTAISVTRLIMEWRVGKLGRAPLVISGITWLNDIGNKKPVQFMRARFFGLILSGVLSAASLVLVFSPGLHYGIDFSGGSLVEVQAEQLSVGKLREGLDAQKLDVALQEFGEHGHYLVRLPLQNANDVASGNIVQEVKDAIHQIAPDATFPRVEMVGPRVSGDFADASILAILIAGAGMLAYLWFRFESHFAIGAMLTIGLDLTKTIGFFVLANIEFNLTAVAALLALIGYSVNDKVVVFDRIREKLRATPNKPLIQLFNESITSTLTRTIFTSVTTFLALLPMAIAGGSAVSSFSLPMLFGIVVGTSSSILIAAPIVLLLGNRRMRKGVAQLRPSPEAAKRELDAMP
jgi:SecD/SecF fusion protein